MALLITLALLGGIWLALYIYCRIRFGFARNIPEVEPLRFFFGNGLDFAQKNSYEIFVSINRVFREYKRIFKISFGPIKVICPTHPDLIQKVLCNSASMDKPYVYDFTRMGSGLLTAPYDTWKVHRKLLNPTFNTRILNSFIPIFNDCADKMIESIKEHAAPGKVLNILEFTSPCTLAMICRTSLGGKVLEREGTQKFVEGLEIILSNVGLRMFNANLHPDIVYRFTRFYRKEMESRKFCYAFTDKIIVEKQQELAEAKAKGKQDTNNNANDSGNDNFEEEEDDLLSYKKPQIFIDQLLTIPLPDGKPFSHKEISDHIYTMIAAGNETSATQAAHTLMYLAMHPEVQEKAVKEIKELLPTPESTITSEVMKNMVYMERIIKESQRLAPVAAVYGRKTIAELQLDQFTIPKGNIFVLNIFALHRRKEYWGEDADLFNPDRFLPENSKNRHPFAYLPFSGGNRGCIGNRYAMMSMKTIVTAILRNFKITTDLQYEKIEFKFKVSMHLSGPHRTFVEPRNLYG